MHLINKHSLIILKDKTSNILKVLYTYNYACIPLISILVSVGRSYAALLVRLQL